MYSLYSRKGSVFWSIICSVLIGLDFPGGISLAHRVADLKMTGGQNAARGKWPWQALVLVKKEKQESTLTLCGGTLIRPDLVITAAHCVERQVKIRVYFGVWNVTNRVEVGRSLHFAKRVTQHPCYDGIRSKSFSASNIALIWLANPNYRSASLCIESNSNLDWNDLKGGKSLGGCYATGYGVTETGQDAEYLQEVKFSSVSKKSCSVYGTISSDNDILCAYDEVITGKDSCKGDMGGPLMCPTSREGCGGFYLAGVTLAGSTKCGNEGKPGIYAAVYPNVEWIQSEILREEERKKGRDTATPVAYTCVNTITKVAKPLRQAGKPGQPARQPETLTRAELRPRWPTLLVTQICATRYNYYF